MINNNINFLEEIIDIIIINYNSTDYSLRCIESLQRNLNFSHYRIIVVDNNSDDMPDRITDKYPEVVLINNSTNIGFGSAINYAITLINGKYVILLNPDSLVIDNSFKKLINYLDQHDDTAIAGPKILESDGSLQGSARRFPTIWTSIFGRKSPLTKLFPSNPITKREFICFNCEKLKTQTVDWVSGACMVIRSEAIKQVGGFDTRFFMYWEDADLCKRLTEFGWKIAYYPKAQVYHHTGKSSATCPLSSIYHFHKSCFYYFRKHSTWPIKILTPFAFLGLGLRCLFVIELNLIQQIIGRMRLYLDKKNIEKTGQKKVKNKLKILRIVSRLNIGGPSIHCSILTKGLSKTLFETKLVAGKGSSHEGDMSYLINSDNGFLLKIPELQREINFWYDIMAFYKIVKTVFREKPDIVHTHMAKAGAVSRAAVFVHNLVSRKKIKTVHTFHGNVLTGYFNPQISKFFIGIEKALAKVTDVIIAISQTQKWELTQKFGLASDDKVHIINLGFDLTRFSSTNGNRKLRSYLGVGDETFLIGIIGRLVPIKNHVLFMDSAKLIMEKYPRKDLRFIIIGDGELRKQLESYAQEIGIGESVVFYGWEKEIQDVYADLDMLLLTSNNEGTPVSIIESMASGVPVVTTGVGGVKDLLGRIKTSSSGSNGCSICERGILCPKGNAEAVANGIQYLIENDNQDLVNKARNFVYENYTDKRLIQRIENLYENLIYR
jgi:GT2 family glycosyltransferase